MWRCFALQSLALAGPCFIQIGIGIELTCSTIIIGALAIDNSKNGLPPLTNEQASWFGKMTYFYTKLFGLDNNDAIWGRGVTKVGIDPCLILKSGQCLVGWNTISDTLTFLQHDWGRPLYDCMTRGIILYPKNYTIAVEIWWNVAKLCDTVYQQRLLIFRSAYRSDVKWT